MTDETIDEFTEPEFEAVEEARVIEMGYNMLGSATAVAQLLSAVGKIQRALGKVKRTAKVDAGRRSFAYAPLSEIVGALHEAVDACDVDVSFVQPMSCTADGTVVLTLTVSGCGALINSTLQAKAARLPIPDEMAEGMAGKVAQDFGAFTTYMRRYQLASFWCIEASRDVDDQGIIEPPKRAAAPRAPKPPPLPEKPRSVVDLKRRIADLCKEQGVPFKDLPALIGADKLVAALTETELQQVIGVLEAR